MLSAMIEDPTTIPGPRLAEQRRGYGITRRALADRLGLHRNTLRAWETAHSVDVLRQRRYIAALRALIDAPDVA
jgi:transcriptional regulator with XRE-family HTH domain